VLVICFYQDKKKCIGNIKDDLTKKMTDYSQMLSLAYPGAGWSLLDITDFQTLAWDSSNSSPQPTLSELLVQLESVKPDEALRLLREKRNQILSESDMYALPDFPHPDEATKQAWLSYRQALRDVMENNTPTLAATTLELDESSVIWPPKPSDVM
jgi:hypothetical protein